eukprot:6596882-Prymnesium_polylepis.1
MRGRPMRWVSHWTAGTLIAGVWAPRVTSFAGNTTGSVTAGGRRRGDREAHDRSVVPNWLTARASARYAKIATEHRPTQLTGGATRVPEWTMGPHVAVRRFSWFGFITSAFDTRATFLLFRVRNAKNALLLSVVHPEPATRMNHAIDYDFRSGQESPNVPSHFTHSDVDEGFVIFLVTFLEIGTAVSDLKSYRNLRCACA